MTNSQFERFSILCRRFRLICKETEKNAGEELVKAQRLLAGGRGAASYKIETPVLYNTSLDKTGVESNIRLILVADNPGRKEQSREFRSYLAGPSGKIAESFFKKETSLGIDFRRDVLILNKTPVHTARTADLKTLLETGGDAVREAVLESQVKMAALLADFYEVFKVPVWITGYSEMRPRGIFEVYTRELRKLVSLGAIPEDAVFFYRHFSMNQFSIDLSRRRLAGESTRDALNRAGVEYRRRILGETPRDKN